MYWLCNIIKILYQKEIIKKTWSCKYINGEMRGKLIAQPEESENSIKMIDKKLFHIKNEYSWIRLSKVG